MLLIFLLFCVVCFVLFLIVLCLVSSVGCVYGLSSLVCDRSVSYTQYCQCLRIDQSCLWSFCALCPVFPMSMEFPVLFVIVMCLVPNVANVYELSSVVCDRSVTCVQCSQCLWIVQSCLWSFCILCLVLSISLDCPVLIALLVFCNVYVQTIGEHLIC